MIFGVDEKGERRENSNGSVLVLESYFTVIEGVDFGFLGGDICESELLDETVSRVRLEVDGFCFADN